MRKQLCTIAAAMLTIATAAVSSPSPALAITAAPFTAKLSGHAAIAGLRTFAFTGHGTATYMGPVTDKGKLTVTGFSSKCLLGLPHVHIETITDAEGDTLTFTMHDLACPTGVLRFHGTGTWTVTGGTGLFAGASGLGTGSGDADFIAGKFAITLTGTLTAPLVH